MNNKFEIENNHLTMIFNNDAPFDAGILEKLQVLFKEMDQKSDIKVTAIGNIPIEVLAYITEVSNYCNLTFYITDKKANAFLLHNSAYETMNVILGEDNG